VLPTLAIFAAASAAIALLWNRFLRSVPWPFPVLFLRDGLRRGRL